MSRLWRITECNITVTKWFLRVNLKASSMATTKSHCFTEVIVVARILLRPRYPGHSASSIIMKINCAVKLTNKGRAILPGSDRFARLQAHKIKKTHLLQGINHKVIISGTVHEDLFVDSLGLHKSAIPHMVCRAIEIILETSLIFSPEFPVTTGIGSFLETIGIGLSKFPPGSDVKCRSIVYWLLLHKIVILSCIFAFLPLPY
jgi:hypothetical protein